MANKSKQEMARFERRAERMGCMPGYHVIQSDINAGVAYAINGGDIGIMTAHNGVISMSLEAFRLIAAEANEVFDFWDALC